MKQLAGKLRPRITALPEGCRLKDPAMLLATWFGAGLLRPGPGTMGSLAAIPFGIGLQALYGIPALLAGIVILFGVGVLVSNIYDRKAESHDNSTIVIDEVVGIWIAAIPAATNLWLWTIAFVLFRLFDIWKPWPISHIDRNVSGGLGVMIDDVLAGFLAFCGTAVFALPLLGVL
ncbi:MAG: phosphatidylglycerophosphatase A family protein [Pseudomonadota bacterium]